MGQYHVILNLDKKEFVHPHKLANGLKQWEQVHGGPYGTMTALNLLLTCSVDRGGGDVRRESDVEGGILGRWAGDRIAIVGDYTEDADMPEVESASTLYGRTGHEETRDPSFMDISVPVRTVIERAYGVRYQPPEYKPDDWDTWLDVVRVEEEAPA